ncbi:MAG: DUF488 family protein [Terriglobales bacterium]
MTILTIGHSNRPWQEFLALLQANGVGRLVDLRTVPRSRHNPQFNGEAMPAALRGAGIAYAHLPALGGLRHARADSANTGWRNLSFRGFADYMQTPAFAAGLDQLLALAARPKRRAAPCTAIMCAEAVPWRCHRSLIADALLARGIGVEHIIGRGARRAASLTPFAQVEAEQVTYPDAAAGGG